jgi:hypothetical protein
MGALWWVCTIKTWHPTVAERLEEKKDDELFRTLILKDGGDSDV